MGLIKASTVCVSECVGVHVPASIAPALEVCVCDRWAFPAPAYEQIEIHPLPSLTAVKQKGQCPHRLCPDRGSVGTPGPLIKRSPYTRTSQAQEQCQKRVVLFCSQRLPKR